jgi:hypothetical protein
MSKEPWLGGRAKKAEYDTKTVRVPLACKEAVEALAIQWKRLFVADKDTTQLVKSVEDVIAQSVPGTETIPVTDNKLEVDNLKAEIDILKQSLAAKETELELFKTMSSKPDLSSLHVYQPNRDGGLFKVKDVIGLLEKHYGNS